MAEFGFTSEYFLEISHRCHYNESMAEFYERMADMEYDDLYPIAERDEDRGGRIYDPYDPAVIKMNRYANRAKNIRLCMRFGWASDYYRMNGVKVIKGVNRCRDRFCYNCQSMDALQRFHEYAPFIDGFSKSYDIYHVVFSQPNVPGFLLSRTIDMIYASFSHLVKFLSGKKKIRGLDLVAEYGFAGAVRALEVSQNDKDKYYHPHLHCMMALRKGLNLTPKYRNMFTVDRTHKREDRLFTELEIFFQRVWYLLMNGIRVTKKNLEELPQMFGKSYPDGFSCYAENAQGHYHEIFKYATKGSYKNRTILDFDCFRTMYEALFGRRIYQSCGCFYDTNIDFNVVHDELNLRDMADICFNEILQMLDNMEEPEEIVENLVDILKITIPNEGKTGVRYISAQSVRRAFDELPESERGAVKEKLIKYIWNSYE